MIGMKCTTWMNARELKQAVAEACIEPLDQAAMLVQRAAQTSMRPGNGKPSPAGGPPAIQEGNLLKNIKWAREKDNRVIGPTSQAWYGRVHEFGAVVKVTEKMRWYLGIVLGIWLKKSTKKITIPARPFMYPALVRSRKAIPALFKDLRLDRTQTGRRMNRFRKA